MDSNVKKASVKRSQCRHVVVVSVAALLFGAGAAMAEQARTACILLNGGTIRVLPAGQTNCNALEGAFQLVQPSQPTEKTLSANINANGTVAQQDVYTTAQGATANWLSSATVNQDGRIRLTFAAGLFTAGPSIRCDVSSTTDAVPPAAARFCAEEDEGGCPTPARWVVTTSAISISGVTVDSRDAQYKAQRCNYPPRSGASGNSDVYLVTCTADSYTTYSRLEAPYTPGDFLVVLATRGGQHERSAFAITCRGF